MSDDVTRDEFAQSDDDRAFERLLLRSASYDGPPPGAGAAAFAALVRAGGEAAIFEGAASGVAAKAAASKALLVGVGVLVGSAVTLAVLWPPGKQTVAALSAQSAAANAPGAPEVAAPPSSTLEPHTELLVSSASSPGSGSATSVVVDGPPALGPSQRTPRGGPRAHGEHGVSSGSNSPSQPDSTLLREVLALDGIRAALGRAAYDDALRRVDAFHAEFPRAQLAADAEALGVRALEGKHEGAAAKRRAERFLQHYPNDPHAVSVQPHPDEP